MSAIQSITTINTDVETDDTLVEKLISLNKKSKSVPYVRQCSVSAGQSVHSCSHVFRRVEEKNQKKNRTDELNETTVEIKPILQQKDGRRPIWHSSGQLV